jgi:hypothetical protein
MKESSNLIGQNGLLCKILRTMNLPLIVLIANVVGDADRAPLFPLPKTHLESLRRSGNFHVKYLAETIFRRGGDILLRILTGELDNESVKYNN